MLPVPWGVRIRVGIGEPTARAGGEDRAALIARVRDEIGETLDRWRVGADFTGLHDEPRRTAVNRSVTLLPIAITLGGHGVHRSLYVPAMLVGPPVPLLLVGVLLQAVFGIVAGICVWPGVRWAPRPSSCWA